MNQILPYFSGKSLENAKVAVELLKASEAQGSWVPKASQKVRAALGKANVAKKTLLKLMPAHTYKSPKDETALYYALTYGSLGNLLLVDFTTSNLPVPVLQYVRDFQPVAALLKKLDDTRPKPVFTALGVSPTVTATLTRLNLKPETVRICPIEWYEVEVQVNGKPQRQWRAKLLWPVGAVHGASKFHATANNQQCQACGHAIRNAYNWVPLLLDGADGKTYSLWVGKDCSKKLFGIEVKGELELEGRI